MTQIPSFAELLLASQKLLSLQFSYWYQHVFLTWRWWLLVSLLLLPWVLFFVMLKRSRANNTPHHLHSTVTFGLIIILFVFLLDALGNELGLWAYPYNLIFILPKSLTFDLSVIPVSYMLLYYFSPSRRKFLVALLSLSFLFAFVGEPLAVWLQLYQPIHWSHFYSFPIYFLIGVIARIIVDKLNGNNRK